jgi:hypothetical protein
MWHRQRYVEFCTVMISGFISFKDYNTSYWHVTHGVQSVSRWYTRSKASVTVDREWRRPWRQKWNGTYALAKPRSTRLAVCTQAEFSYIWQILVTCGYFPLHRNLHLCRYWQLVRFPQIVGIWDTKESPVFTYQVEPCCVFTTPLYLTYKCFCVDSQYDSVLWLASCGNGFTKTRQICSRCNRLRICAK